SLSFRPRSTNSSALVIYIVSTSLRSVYHASVRPSNTCSYLLRFPNHINPRIEALRDATQDEIASVSGPLRHRLGPASGGGNGEDALGARNQFALEPEGLFAFVIDDGPVAIVAAQSARRERLHPEAVPLPSAALPMERNRRQSRQQDDPDQRQQGQIPE